MTCAAELGGAHVFTRIAPPPTRDLLQSCMIDCMILPPEFPTPQRMVAHDVQANPLQFFCRMMRIGIMRN
jgi:hypothetical protein